MYRSFGELGTDPVLIASAISSFIGVIFLGINTAVVDDELKAVVHETAVAPFIVGRIAIHQFLFR